jgi:dTMP kinase
MSAGRFITFEGIEGTGKSTQIARLADRLRASGCDTRITREPGGTDLGLQLRALLLRPDDRSISPLAELLLYTTDRVQHLEEVVEPALRQGAVVLCDRYLDATLAYQGYGRGLGVERILALHRHPPLDRRPDRTILIDVDPVRAVGRARQRNVDLDLDSSEGRFERERIDFHRRVRDGYLRLAAEAPRRIRRVDGSGDPDEVERRVLEALQDLLPELRAETC